MKSSFSILRMVVFMILFSEMCQIQINKLARGGMLIVDETASITPTFLGELMARYYLAFDTMKLLTQVSI